MKKKLVALLLVGILTLGSTITASATSGTWQDSGNVVYYSSSISRSNGNAFTHYASGSESSMMYVVAQYHYHENVTHATHMQSESAAGQKMAQVSFSCPVSCSSSYITATHTYVVNGNAKAGSTSAVY